MSRLSALSPAKWIPTVSQISNSITSAVVFFVLDFLDTIMCVFFRYFDGFLEGECSPCYCKRRPGMIQENKDDFLELERDKELSESLHGRRNLFREMGMLRNPRVPSKKEGLCVGEVRSRWSDCGCESCVSWMSSGSSDFRLHVIVKESPKARQEHCSHESSVQNVILIHGFLSSSSFWTESVFPNLSEHTNQNHRIFAVDLLGFGSSPKPKSCSYTLKEHLEMVEPYFSSSKGDASLAALERLAMRRVWPPVLFVSALMSWHEHLGRCVCFFNKAWEWILKLLTRTRPTLGLDICHF